MKIAAMILAAGESKRMGEPKLLLPFGKKTIIETVIDSVIKSGVDEILVVLGSSAEKIEKKIKDFPLRKTVNPDYKQGMLSSVQWGFKVLSDEIQGVLVCLGDQPSISAVVIDKIIDAYKQTGKGIVVPTYKRRRGHPVLIGIKYLEEIKNLSPDVGLRGVVYNHPEDTHEVEVDTVSILRDIDNPDDYNKELKEE
jgi:molybdenum cofactor cytidylyltransferase